MTVVSQLIDFQEAISCTFLAHTALIVFLEQDKVVQITLYWHTCWIVGDWLQRDDFGYIRNTHTQRPACLSCTDYVVSRHCSGLYGISECRLKFYSVAKTYKQIDMQRAWLSHLQRNRSRFIMALNAAVKKAFLEH